MRRETFVLLVVLGLAGCGERPLPNYPAPPPQDSGADKGTTEPKPVPPPKK